MTGRKDLFQESMELGHSAAWDREWDRAIEYYRKALAEFPDDASALINLGLALLEVDRTREALAVYNQASKAAPQDPIPPEKCAEIFEKLGQKREAILERKRAADRYMQRRDADKAIENWSHIARLAPNELAIRSRLAMAFERLGRRKEAVHEYAAVASLCQRADNLEGAINALHQALRLAPGDADLSKAMQVLRQGASLPPPLPPLTPTRPLKAGSARAAASLIQEIEAAERKADSDGASAAVDVADPETAAQEIALSILATLMFDDTGKENGNEPGTLGMSNITKGISKADRESVGKPSAYRYLGQGIDMFTRGNARQAAKEFQRAIETGLDHPAAHYILGLLLKQMGQGDQARAHLLEARAHPDLALGANLALGRLSKADGELHDASQYLLQALRLADTLTVDDSESSHLNQLYDTIMASQDDGEEGDEQALSGIVENTLKFLTGPHWLQRVRQAREQLEIQREGPAVMPLAEMLTLGGSQRVLEALGRIDRLAERGLVTSAMEEAMLALNQAPGYLGLHRRIAELLLLSGRNGVALSKLNAIARTHLVRGEGKQAIEIYRRILSLSPVDSTARGQLIEVLTQQDRYEEAVEQYVELGELYRNMAQIDQARTALADALRVAQRGTVDPGLSLKVLNQIADMDLARLDWRKALETYEQIISINPEDDQARSHVIDLNLRLGREPQAARELDRYLEHLVGRGEGAHALELLEDLVREHPGKQELHSRLAEAYRAAGRKADAIAQYDALGEIQLDAGQVKEAVQTIRTILGMEPPDSEGYEELLRNLEAGR